MSRPVVGIIANNHLINDEYLVQGGGAMIVEALAEVASVMPLIVPITPGATDVDALMAACDGFLFPGGRPNVHPHEYGEDPTDAHGTFQPERDKLALGLIRACVARGQPIFGICLGFQEVNVAMGGTLYPEIRDLPGRDNHRMPPDGTLEEKFGRTHEVTLTQGGPFHQILGIHKVVTNTLHGQGIKEPGARIVIDGHAPDGTPEAIYVADAPGFTMAVQWHPEWNAASDPVSRPLFEAFGDACRAWATTGRLRDADPLKAAE